MDTLKTDTIAALATPPGKSAVAMFRVSGPNAFPFCDAVLRHRKNCGQYAGQTIHRALVVDGEDIVDDVLVAVFHAPRSYTGEDIVEITCHGGSVPIRRIAALLLRRGARMADPGEFTLRAYLNGKLDLAQAEAVVDAIDARTDEAFRLAQSQQAGRLSREIHSIRDRLIGIIARIEATIDFPEDVGGFPIAWCKTELVEIKEHLKQLISTAGRGMLYRDGITVALVGEPNVGKSSLMNALLRSDRAIVTSIPGTTRDTIEESISIQGIPVRLIDTAGLRETSDEVEEAGIYRTRAAIDSADIVLHVQDASSIEVAEAVTDSSALITVLNKSDLVPNDGVPRIGISVSALTGAGIEALEAAIAELALSGVGAIDKASAGVTITHTRHLTALQDAKDTSESALQALDESLPLDFLSIEVQAALTAVGRITGETAPQDVINEIFHRFCIGK